MAGRQASRQAGRQAGRTPIDTKTAAREWVWGVRLEQPYTNNIQGCI